MVDHGMECDERAGPTETGLAVNSDSRLLGRQSQEGFPDCVGGTAAVIKNQIDMLKPIVREPSRVVLSLV